MKKLLTTLTLLLLVSWQTPVTTLKFEFTIEETNVILNSLSKLPYEQSASLINKIQLQAQKQLSDTLKK